MKPSYFLNRFATHITAAAALLFAAALQAQGAATVVKPTAVPNHIPIDETTLVLFRAKVDLTPGNEFYDKLYVIENLPKGQTVLGAILPDPSAGPNVFSGRIPLNRTVADTLNLVIATSPPGAAGVTSNVFTVTVFGAPMVSHLIDPNVLTGATELPDEGFGPRPLAAVEDGDGITSRFVANQVIFTGSSEETNAFLTRHGGKVVAQIPTVNSPKIQPTALILLDPAAFSTTNLDTNATKMGGRGQMKFSSDIAVRLAALVASEVSSGQRVALNFVYENQDFLWSTKEEKDQNSVNNAFNWPEFDHQAWEFVAANGFTRRVNLAVIDGGFWLNSLGEPFTDSAGRSDLPKHPIQWNPLTASPFAGGVNLNTCTGGSSCPWHGNQSASVALGSLNNDAGAAGTGGQVANPMLMLFDGSDFTVESDIATAMTYGADIISMSFEGHCGFWCGAGHTFGSMDGIMDSALDSGILLVAAAGNDASDAESVDSWPCTYSSDNNIGVYCVGALGSNNDVFGYFESYTRDIASYSNYGLGVNIWAPTNIHAMPNGSSGSALVVHNGTSASTPYVAGVAAMIKALNPSLDGEQIKGIIGDWPYFPGTSSWDSVFTNYPWSPNVGFVIQPYPAVVEAAGGYHLKPDLKITAPKDDEVFKPYTKPIQFKAFAQDVNDGPLASTVVWTSDVDGELGVGTSITHDFTYAKEGVRHITAKATNSYGFSSSKTIKITIKFAHIDPKPVIIWPTNGLTINPGTYTVSGWAQSTDPGINLLNIPCNKLVWNGGVSSVNLPDSTGECEAQLTFKPGKQNVTLTAPNKFGDKGTTTVSINVAPSTSLTVNIVDPPDGSMEYLDEGGSEALALDGNANGPFIKGGAVEWFWYWYYTGSAQSTEQLIGTSKTGHLSWIPQNSGFCTGSTGGNITLHLDVVDSTADPFKIVSGSGESRIDIQCLAPPK